MEFQEPVQGTILKRYKRFLADIELPSGETITAHTPNTGSMTSCWEPGWPVVLSHHNNPKRKLAYTLEATYNGDSWIGVNTSLTNRIVEEALKAGLVKEIPGPKEFGEQFKPEKKRGKSRLDFWLATKEKEFFIEVKNATLRVGSEVHFPDAISTRGQKHLEELIDIQNEGHQAVMLFLVNREDVNTFRPADGIDSRYGELLRMAHSKGVWILAYQCKLSETEIKLSHSIPVKL